MGSSSIVWSRGNEFAPLSMGHILFLKEGHGRDGPSSRCGRLKLREGPSLSASPHHHPARVVRLGMGRQFGNCVASCTTLYGTMYCTTVQCTVCTKVAASHFST